jgi:hypothetical protein
VWDEAAIASEYRTGTVLYQVEKKAEPSGGAVDKRFAIIFTELRRADGRADLDAQQHYVFAEGWLADIDHGRKQFIKRQIVPPGKSFDPLQLGQGPFPLPVGQPKAEVLARYDASLIAAPDEKSPDQLQRVLKEYPEVIGLRLVPRTKSEADDTVLIDVYYDRATLLPVGVNLVDDVGNRKTVRLSKAVRNGGLTDEEKAKLSIANPDPKAWRIDIRPWED